MAVLGWEISVSVSLTLGLCYLNRSGQFRYRPPWRLFLFQLIMSIESVMRTPPTF